MDNIVVLIDGSQRSLHSMELIQKIVKDLHMKAQLGVVLNRWKDRVYENDLKNIKQYELPLLGIIPEDEELQRNDASGKSVFELSDSSPILKSVRMIANSLTTSEEIKLEG